MLVVDGNALRVVDLLHFLHQVDLDRLWPHDAQDVLRVGLAIGELLASLHLSAVLHAQPHVAWRMVLSLLRLLVDDGDVGWLALAPFEDDAATYSGGDLLNLGQRRLFGLLLSLGRLWLANSEDRTLLDLRVVLHL